MRNKAVIVPGTVVPAGRSSLYVDGNAGLPVQVAEACRGISTGPLLLVVI